MIQWRGVGSREGSIGVKEKTPHQSVRKEMPQPPSWPKGYPPYDPVTWLYRLLALCAKLRFTCVGGLYKGGHTEIIALDVVQKP